MDNQCNIIKKMPRAGDAYWALVPYIFQGSFSSQMEVRMVIWANTVQDYLNYYIGNCFVREPSREDIGHLAGLIRSRASVKHVHVITSE